MGLGSLVGRTFPLSSGAARRGLAEREGAGADGQAALARLLGEQTQLRAS